MGERSRYRTDDSTDLLKRIAMLEARLSKLERTNQLSNSAVNAGEIVVNGGRIQLRKDDDLAQGFIEMATGYSADGQVGMSFQVARSNTVESGTESVAATAMLFTTVEGENPDIKFPTVQIYDKSGAVIFSDTFNARKGMADPRLHTTWWDPNGYKLSTSGTFAGAAQALHYHYHPNIRISGYTQNDGGNTSEVRVVDLDTGNVIAGPVTGPAGVIQSFAFTIDRDDTLNGGGFGNGNSTWLEVQHRRATGAGTVRTLIIEVLGLDVS